MSKMSKIKGSNFERTICKKLTIWFNNNKLNTTFHRVPASGGLNWGNFSKGATIGDIICDNLNFTQTIECKNREDWEHKQFIEINVPCKSGLYSWWDQACNEANKANKNPWLIIKKNYCKELLIFSTIDNPSWYAIDSIKEKVVITYLPTFIDYGWNKVCIVPLKLFLKTANPKMFLFREEKQC